MSIREHLDVAGQALELADEDALGEEEANELWLAHLQLERLAEMIAMVDATLIARVKVMVAKAGRPIRVDGGVVRTKPKIRRVWTGKPTLHKALLNALTVTEEGEVVRDRDYTEEVITQAIDLYATTSTAPRGPAVRALGLQLEELFIEEHVGEQMDFIDDTPKPYRRRR